MQGSKGNIGKANHRLTNKQVRLLRFIYDFREEHGDGPTLTMMVKGLDLASNRSAIDMLKLLVTNGYLKQNAKISRSTILTSMALLEINAIKQPEFQVHHPRALPVQSYIHQSTQEVNTQSNPRLSWNRVPQPTGSQASGLASETTKLLGNVLSNASHWNSGTGTKNDIKGTKLSPLVFMMASGIIIYLMFGTGVQATVLVMILMIVTSIRGMK